LEINEGSISRRCNYARHLNDFKIVRFTTSKQFFIDVFEIFRKQGVAEEDIEFLSDQIENGRTNHTTTGRKEREEMSRRVRGDPYLMRKLVQMYFYDFLLLGYPIPDITNDELS
jgi:hypothetical protein